MSIPMPQLQVGAPLTWNALHVFPLYADASACGDYQLADEAKTIGDVGDLPNAREGFAAFLAKRRPEFR